MLDGQLVVFVNIHVYYTTKYSVATIRTYSQVRVDIVFKINSRFSWWHCLNHMVLYFACSAGTQFPVTAFVVDGGVASSGCAVAVLYHYVSMRISLVWILM